MVPAISTAQDAKSRKGNSSRSSAVFAVEMYGSLAQRNRMIAQPLLTNPFSVTR